MPSAETSASRCCGTSSGSASMLISFVTWVRTPPSLDADRSPTSVIATAVWIGWSRRTSWRSMCVIVAAHLVALVVLEDRRVRRAAVDRDVEHGVRPGRAVVSAARSSRSPIAIATGLGRGRRGRPGSAPACAGAGTRRTRAWSARKRRA